MATAADYELVYSDFTTSSFDIKVGDYTSSSPPSSYTNEGGITIQNNGEPSVVDGSTGRYYFIGTSPTPKGISSDGGYIYWVDSDGSTGGNIASDSSNNDISDISYRKETDIAYITKNADSGSDGFKRLDRSNSTFTHSKSFSASSGTGKTGGALEIDEKNSGVWVVDKNNVGLAAFSDLTLKRTNSFSNTSDGSISVDVSTGRDEVYVLYQETDSNGVETSYFESFDRKDGTKITSISRYGGSGSLAASHMVVENDHPYFIEYDSGNNNYRVGYFQGGMSQDDPSFSSSFSGKPKSMSIDEDGSVLVGDDQGRIRKFTKDTSQSRNPPTEDWHDQPEGTTFFLFLDAYLPNQPPNASLTVTNSDNDLDVFADASASSDPDGDSLTYDYDWDDGTSSSGAGDTTNNTYSSAGNYTVTVTVDDGIETDTATDSVTAYLNEIDVNDGGTIKDILDVQVNDGGTIKDVKRVFVNDGGTIKKVWENPNA